MQRGDSPLDFINKNLAAEPAAPFTPSTMRQAPAESASNTVSQASEGVKPSVVPLTTTDPLPQVKKEGAKPEESTDVHSKEANSSQASEEGTDDLEVPNIPAAENFKKLREKTKTLNQSLKDTQTQKAALEKELEDYKTGATVPDVLKTKEDEIARLSRYEKLHSLKTSKEYKENFVKPLEEIKGKLKEVANDYGIPDDIINTAFGLTNRAELNRFLLENFDELGALQVRELLDKARGITTQIQAAEAEPAQVLAEITKQHEQMAEAQETERWTNLQSAARNHWLGALGDLRNEGKVVEVIRDPSNPEHNAKIVDPILAQASQEYGKLLTGLGEAGLQKMPDELGKALGKMFLLAHASAYAIQSRGEALKYASEISKNAERLNPLIRPQIGGGNSSKVSADQVPGVPKTAQEEARTIMSGIMGRK